MRPLTLEADPDTLFVRGFFIGSDENQLGFIVKFLEYMEQERNDLSDSHMSGIGSRVTTSPERECPLGPINDRALTPRELHMNSLFYSQSVTEHPFPRCNTRDWCAELLENNLESHGEIIKFRADINIYSGKNVAHVFFSDGLNVIFHVSAYFVYKALKEFRMGNLDEIIPILKSEVSVPPVIFNVRREPPRQLSFIDEIPGPPLSSSSSSSSMENFPKFAKKIHNAKKALKEYGKFTPLVIGTSDKYDNCIECSWYSLAFYKKRVGHVIAIENNEDFEIVKSNFVDHMNEAHPDICARKMKLKDAAKYT